MRIAIFIPGFQKDEFDWCIPAFTNLAAELSREAEVHVFTLRYPQVRAYYRVSGVHVHAVGGGALNGIRLPGISLVKLWADLLHLFDRVHRKTHFDVLVGIWATESGALACAAGRRWGLPVLVHLAGGELVSLNSIGYGNWGRGLAGALVGVSLKYANKITVPSTHMEELLRLRHPVACKRATLWPLGVDTELFSRPDGEVDSLTEPFTFVTVASLLPVKGLDLYVDAAAELRATHPDYKFRVFIVGEGPERTRLAAKIALLGLEGYVVLVGERNHSELPAIFARSHCFVMTSWHEAQGMALLEAAAAGLPWIATPVGAATDMARSMQPSGYLLADRNPSTMADTMHTMMQLSPGEREAMGREARSQVLTSFDLRQQAPILLGHLRALTSTRVGRRIKAHSPRSVTLDVITLMRELAVISLLGRK